MLPLPTHVGETLTDKSKRDVKYTHSGVKFKNKERELLSGGALALSRHNVTHSKRHSGCDWPADITVISTGSDIIHLAPD